MPRSQARPRRHAVELQSAPPQTVPTCATGRNTAMSGEELVKKFVLAGQNIFAETDLAREIQVDILTGIALVIGTKLGSHETSGRPGNGLVPEASVVVVADDEARASATTRKSQLKTVLTAVTLATMKLKERRSALERHYRGRTRWADVRPRKPQEPMPDHFQQWAERNFPDRQQLGLVLSDLSALDKEAYGKLRHWANPRGHAAKIDPARFGFPSKVVRYDPAKPVPTGAELFKAVERGDPRAAELRRDYMRARYHLRRDN
jgi:hypothetical protein